MPRPLTIALVSLALVAAACGTGASQPTRHHRALLARGRGDIVDSSWAADRCG